MWTPTPHIPTIFYPVPQFMKDLVPPLVQNFAFERSIVRLEHLLSQVTTEAYPLVNGYTPKNIFKHFVLLEVVSTETDSRVLFENELNSTGSLVFLGNLRGLQGEYFPNNITGFYIQIPEVKCGNSTETYYDTVEKIKDSISNLVQTNNNPWISEYSLEIFKHSQVFTHCQRFIFESLANANELYNNVELPVCDYNVFDPRNPNDPCCTDSKAWDTTCHLSDVEIIENSVLHLCSFLIALVFS